MIGTHLAAIDRMLSSLSPVTQMLTLASNERIPLIPSMRLLLEINHMTHCSPATVSRGGVIFVNADDIGWKPVRKGCCPLSVFIPNNWELLP
jgi:hypothetical protein